MSPPNQPEKSARFLPVFEKQGHPQAVSGEIERADVDVSVMPKAYAGNR
jgi:hypothetical protein